MAHSAPVQTPLHLSGQFSKSGLHPLLIMRIVAEGTKGSVGLRDPGAPLG